jgi:nucleoside-diphosphate-sugar epimerase
MKILITGSTGFVGKALLWSESARARHTLRGAARRVSVVPDDVETILVQDLSAETDWSAALDNVQVVLHCAARVHVMNDVSADPLQEFRRVNVEGTLNLARQAVAAGVKRFIFLSSIKVNGEESLPGHPYHADDTPAPADPYGISKYEAEQGLLALARQTGLEVVIIRPVLVYGPGVKANFLSMVLWLSRGVPLPLGALTSNRRSMVALDNLVDLILTCAAHPSAANQIFLVSDGEDLSTTDLLQRTARSMHKKALLVPVPARMLQWTAKVLGKVDVARRLCGSLQVDIRKTRELLGWSPPLDVDTALVLTTSHLLQIKGN